MGRDFLLPDLGEGLTEAEVVNWLVAVGDTIAIDQPVVEVESAKSIVELPSPFGGVVEKLFGEVGEVIHAGSVLLTVADDSAAAAPAPATVPPVKAAAPEDPAGETGRPLVGYGPSESTRGVRRPAGGRFGRNAAPAEAPAPVAAVALLDPARRSPVVSPLVRRLAKEHGFEASQLIGTGANSLVLRGDVEAYIRSVEAPAEEVAPVTSGAGHGSARHGAEPSGTAGPARCRAEPARCTRGRHPHPDHRSAQGRLAAPDHLAPGNPGGDHLDGRRRHRAVHRA